MLDKDLEKLGYKRVSCNEALELIDKGIKVEIEYGNFIGGGKVDKNDVYLCMRNFKNKSNPFVVLKENLK